LANPPKNVYGVKLLKRSQENKMKSVRKINPIRVYTLFMHFGQAKENKSEFGCFEMILKLAFAMNSQSINRFKFKLNPFFMTFTCDWEWN